MNENTSDPREEVVNFDAEFANDPDRDAWRAFGEEAKQTFDSADTAIQGISLSVKLHNLMQSWATRLGDKYARKDFTKRADLVLSAFNVPNGINANQLIPIVWVMKLDQSVPSTEPGKPRSWQGSTSNPEWFGGSLTFVALRTLAKLMRRVSGKTQMDEWDFKDGWEPYAREYIKQLRGSQLSLRGLEILIRQRENEVEAEKTRASQAGMTPDQVKAVQEADALVEHNKKIEKLGSDLLTAYSTAVKDLKMDKDAFTALLRNKSIIAPAPVATKPTPAEFAKSMTPGDAKALVQAVVELVKTDPTRFMLVLKSLQKTSYDAVKQLQSASSPNQPAIKVA